MNVFKRKKNFPANFPFFFRFHVLGTTKKYPNFYCFLFFALRFSRAREFRNAAETRTSH